MAITAIMGAGAGKLKLTETLECETSYGAGGSVTTTQNHKYVLIVGCGYYYEKRHGGWAPTSSITAGTEIIKNMRPTNDRIDEDATVSLYKDVPAGTRIESQSPPGYSEHGGLFVLCFD